MSRRGAGALAALAGAIGLAGLAACGGAAPRAGGTTAIVKPRAVPAASGAPRVDQVLDLGEPVALPAEGTLSLARSDGKITVGEYVLVSGSDFGKLPTVLIGGRPARVLARTSGGGIVTQVPAGVAGGAIDVEVSHPAGKHSRSIDVARHAVALQPGAGKAHVIALGDEVVAAAALDVPAARALRVSLDGAWAYVAGGAYTTTPKADGARLAGGGDAAILSTIALAAPGGPAVTHKTKIAGRVLDVALGGRLFAVLGDAGVQLFLLEEPGQPAPFSPWKLPDEVAGAVAIDLSRDGKIMVIADEANALHVFDLAVPEAPQALTRVDLLPGKRLPLVRDLAFDGSGILWVITGDTPRSASVGHQGTRLVKVDPDGWKVAGSVDVAGAGPPLTVAPSPREGLASATTIGDTDDDLPIVVTTLDQKLVPLHGAPMADVLAAAGTLAEPGQLVRSDRAGRGGPIGGVSGHLVGGAAITPDATWIVASAWRLDGAAGGGVRFGALVLALGGAGVPIFVELGPVSDGSALFPASLGDVGIQP